jgi:hypothetical protein
MEVKGPLHRHCRQGGAGCTWPDAALDVVSEHGYTILSDDKDRPGHQKLEWFALGVVGVNKLLTRT